MITKYVADLMTKPGNSPVFGSPADFDLEYEDVIFEASDGVTLSGWLVHGGTDRVIIQTHFGILCSRSGYTPQGKGLSKAWDDDIVFLRQAKHLVDAGYTVLMYDLRNHGRSDVGPCPWVSGGVEEYRDVLAAVDFIGSHPRYEDASIGLLSVCMGAAASTNAFDVEGGLGSNHAVKAMIAIQPIAFDVFIREVGVPGFVAERANQLNLRRGGKDFRSSCLSVVGSVSVPTLVVQNSNDPWTDLDWVGRYYDALNVEKEMYWIDGPKKRLAAYEHFCNHPEKMLEWFDKHV